MSSPEWSDGEAVVGAGVGTHAEDGQPLRPFQAARLRAGRSDEGVVP